VVRGSRHPSVEDCGATVGHVTVIEIARCTRECAWPLVIPSYKTNTRIFRRFINEALSGECTQWVLSPTKVVNNIIKPVIRIFVGAYCTYKVS
jgi:hypothetical protein